MVLYEGPTNEVEANTSGVIVNYVTISPIGLDPIDAERRTESG